MELSEALHGRFTADEFTDEVPGRDVIESLIEAATWAPNHFLTEPWRFHVYAGDERAPFGEALADWLESDDFEETPDEDVVRRVRSAMLRSPVTIVISQVENPEPRPGGDLEDYAACCCATQNLMLAAHAEGLATKWATGRMTRYQRAKELLGLGENDRIVGYVWLGYPAQNPDERTRKPPVIEWRGL